MDAVQLDMFANDPNNRPMLLSAIGEGVKNDCGVYVENVFRFREGKLTGVYVDVYLCAEGDFIIFEFSYQAGNYGCGHPLCRPFQHSVVPYDSNLKNYPKETKELLKLCRKVCDRIAKEVA